MDIDTDSSNTMPTTRPTLANAKYRCFAITLRPYGGIHDEDIGKCLEFVKHHCTHWKLITEKEDDQRHIHGAVITKKSKGLSTFKTEWKRKLKYIEQRTDTVDWRVALKVKNWYNKDWYYEYLAKDDHTFIIEDTMDMVEAKKLFKDNEKRHKQQADAYFFMLEELYKKRFPQKPYPDRQDIDLFLCGEMRIHRTIKVIRSARKFFELVIGLRDYIRKAPRFDYRCNQMPSMAGNALIENNTQAEIYDLPYDDNLQQL